VHCTHWKDRAAPDSTKVMTDLQYIVSDLHTDPNCPILVHCSAGVGRTGTFIGFYVMATKLREAEDNRVSVFETVLQMRRCRRMMVQKSVQYIFLYECLRDFLVGEMSEYEDTQLGRGPSVTLLQDSCFCQYF